MCASRAHARWCGTPDRRIILRMLHRSDTPKHILARRERSRQSKRRIREGRRCWLFEISDKAMEGLIAQAIHTGRLSEAEAADDGCVRRALGQMLDDQGLRWLR